VKIAVCLKRVADMETRFKVAASGTAVDEAGVKFDMGDFDSYAIEVALQLNEKHGGGETVAISVGPDVVQEPLRKAMSMGADRAVQLKADAMPVDGAAVAAALAAELKDGGFDLVLFGRAALDTNAGSVGIMTAELLGLPCVNAISKIDVESGSVVVRRDLEGAAEVLEVPLPAVLGIDEGIARPRYPSLKGIMAAKKKPLESKPAQLGEQRLTVTKMELPADRPPGRIIGEGAAAVPELVKLLQTEAKVI
jgi:electron transfer flavoprotein beta subunit